MKYQTAFERAYRDEIDEAMRGLNEPAVILAGRPYVAFAPEANLSTARKIASRGFTVIPGDALPLASPPDGRNVWHYTQNVMAARDANSHEGRYVCHLSCFSCGPDAILQHRLRRQLEGRPSCFLEIDSHTAHAGIETRIGAFLDIVEASRGLATSRRAAKRVTAACLEQQGDRTWIVTGGGRRLAMDAPEVVHVTLADGPPLVSELLMGFYASLGWRFVLAPNTTAETLQYAKRVCSGRECLPFLSMSGNAVKHLETRPRGEVTVFHMMEQEGPCQIGGWYDAAPLIFERLGEPDAVVAWPSAKNNYLGRGDRMGAIKVAAWLLTGLVATERELRQAAQHRAKVALREPAEFAPRVLLFGGVSRTFIDGPVKEFFEPRGVLVKTTEMSEFICFLQAEDIVRLCFSQGYVAPGQQCSMPVLLEQLVSAGDRASAIRALTARSRIGFVEMLDQRWRRIAFASGLLFSPYVPFSEIERQGHQRISLNGYTEAPVTIGRFAALLAAGAFDGYVNIGTFNCAPANTASAVIHALSLESDTPYALIESDGDCLTSGQLQQLEMVAVQCRLSKEVLHGAVSA